MPRVYAFELISIETYAPQFIGHNRIFLGSVWQTATKIISVKIKIVLNFILLGEIFPFFEAVGYFLIEFQVMPIFNAFWFDEKNFMQFYLLGEIFPFFEAVGFFDWISSDANF